MQCIAELLRRSTSFTRVWRKTAGRTTWKMIVQVFSLLPDTHAGQPNYQGKCKESTRRLSKTSRTNSVTAGIIGSRRGAPRNIPETNHFLSNTRGRDRRTSSKKRFKGHWTHCCGEQGHKAADCWSKNPSNGNNNHQPGNPQGDGGGSDTHKCNGCQQVGHLICNCPN